MQCARTAQYSLLLQRVPWLALVLARVPARVPAP
jgi:hypothetical protein